MDDAEINRKIAEWAVLCRKDMGQATRDVATRFVKAAVKNTPPMIAMTSPSVTRINWMANIEAN